MNISGRNVNSVLSEALSAFPIFAVSEPSRNGGVMTIPEPTTLTYLRPEERVLFWPERDANPFFHFMEALWMLNGHQDLAWPMYFNKKMAEYSDDYYSLHGAYGHRWRGHFRVDQIYGVVRELEKDHNTRRAVIAMWDPEADLGYVGKDIPCNTHIYFRIHDNALHMTVCNRSNDLIWGACGSNVVHFSMLQELLARQLKVSIGLYHQFTNNLHIYDDTPNRDIYRVPVMEWADHYRTVEPYPMMRVTLDEWMEDLKMFMATPLNRSGYSDPFFPEVAVPMMRSWEDRKTKVSNGLEPLEQCKADDWRIACEAWIRRRESAI